jgi:hypothetical protein
MRLLRFARKDMKPVLLVPGRGFEARGGGVSICRDASWCDSWGRGRPRPCPGIAATVIVAKARIQGCRSRGGFILGQPQGVAPTESIGGGACLCRGRANRPYRRWPGITLLRDPSGRIPWGKERRRGNPLWLPVNARRLWFLAVGARHASPSSLPRRCNAGDACVAPTENRPRDRSL